MGSLMISSWPNVDIACDISGYLRGADRKMSTEMWTLSTGEFTNRQDVTTMTFYSYFCQEAT
jgi:hypothetical protein